MRLIARTRSAQARHYVRAQLRGFARDLRRKKVIEAKNFGTKILSLRILRVKTLFNLQF